MKLQASSSDFRLFKNLPLFILKVVLPSIIFLIAIGASFESRGVPFKQLTIDPNEFSSAPPYIGMISMLGILLWWASAAISIFVGWILTKDNELKFRKWSEFLLFSGYITMLLTLDDLLEIHENYYRPFIDLSYIKNSQLFANAFEALFYVFYLILITAHLYRSKTLLKKTNYPILNLSLLFFAISIAVDILTSDYMPLHTSIEEGSKFIGIIIWFSYFLDCCYQQIQKLILNRNYPLSDSEQLAADHRQ